ncbi:hypothetical protein [Vibrio sp. HENC-03]|uniref:hypothetical protein n=1 Tax=Vibrio sp. HENC-03 TaxID=992012 RepID=UPI00028CFDAF|nr:hypothetical protein [Vibrio sp. HENC-03]EKM27719.1 hypothetical protein VCHENC03_3841 [Vibrio sp. HENC-03]
MEENTAVCFFTATNIVEIVKVLAWPVTTLIVALVFRGRLASVIDGFIKRNSVTEFSTPAFTAKFSQDKSGVEVQAEVKRTEISADYQTVVKFQEENQSKHTRTLLKNHQLHRKSYNLTDAEAVEMVEKALVITIAQNAYIAINRVIYKSQLVLLEHMYTQVNLFASTTYVDGYFQQIKPNSLLFANLDTQQYIAYLLDQGLIKVTGEGFALTDYGESYVEYMKRYPNLVTHLNQS